MCLLSCLFNYITIISTLKLIILIITLHHISSNNTFSVTKSNVQLPNRAPQPSGRTTLNHFRQRKRCPLQFNLRPHLSLTDRELLSYTWQDPECRQWLRGHTVIHKETLAISNTHCSLKVTDPWPLTLAERGSWHSADLQYSFKLRDRVWKHLCVKRVEEILRIKKKASSWGKNRSNQTPELLKFPRACFSCFVFFKKHK